MPQQTAVGYGENSYLGSPDHLELLHCPFRSGPKLGLQLLIFLKNMAVAYFGQLTVKGRMLLRRSAEITGYSHVWV